MTHKNKMVSEAEFIWNRLDDLANSDPEAYKQFIAKQMEERDTFFSKPVPMKALTLKLSNKPDQVFINICGWKRIPYPENEEEPIKMMAGFKNSIKLKSGQCQHIFPLALNEKIFEECIQNSTDENLLFNLIFDLIENQFKVKLDRRYKKSKESFLGEKPKDMRQLFLKNYDKSPDELVNNVDLIQSPKDVINLMTNNNNINDKDTNTMQEEFKLMMDDEKHNRKTNQPLISILNESAENVNKSLPEPEYILTPDKTNNKVYSIKIQLPGVDKVGDCDLNINEIGIELTVPDKFYLNLSLPEKLQEDEATAKFNKKKHVLTLMLQAQ